jgi:hypothetical protein
VDTTPPETTITAAPAPTTYVSTASVSFTANEAATFACSLDGGAFAACTSPQSYSGLVLGPHTFRVRATDSAGNVDATPASAGWTIRPANDPFAARQAVAGTSGSVSGTNRYATKETGEPNHAGYVGGHSVWYRWVPPATGAVTFETTASSFDTLLAVYRGTSVSALSLVAANNDASSSTRTSRVRFTASAGVTYVIAVDGVNGASGSVALAWH